LPRARLIKWAGKIAVTRGGKYLRSKQLIVSAHQLNQLANRLVFVEQIHRPATAIGDGGVRIDAEVMVERGEHVLE
jgi:hypothetical protein